ncbi:DUF2312 domain-containing protein [Sinorhizobium meliloti]|nr:DUF2312 domain-containing protein [Sinorhizobium meliloti]MDW9891126.1 DUF2312 domain-containing protein [Sinorhizobium meliloti]MDX0094205.1 DUF2312 domain-containing protein [Sinorhizobium meliloti]
MTDAHFIPDELATRTARLINEAEDMRAQAVDDLKTIYGDLREELKALGWLGQNISKEVAAFKAAISEMRLDEEQKAKREEKGDRIDDYVALLSRSRAGARARTREGNAYADAKLVETVAAGVQTEIGRAALIAAVDIMIEREECFDAETGEILDDHEASAGLTPAVATSLAAREAEESAVSNSEIASASQGETESPSAEAEVVGANAGGGYVESSAQRASVANVASGPDEKQRAPLFAAKPPSTRRPHCLDRAGCGSYTEEHCARCKAAMQEREQAEEVA